MTCECGVRTTRRNCAYCRRTIRLIREGRCVSCTREVVQYGSRIEGRCDRCVSRHVVLAPATRRLLILAAKARYRERVAA